MSQQFHYEASGFTLIELIVVMGLIGILATAMLSIVNPVEQLNKARDSQALSASYDLHSAINRYAANKSRMPWETGGPPGCVGLALSGNFPSTTLVSSIQECLDELILSGELSQSFKVIDELDSIFITEPYVIGGVTPSPTSNSNTSLCFVPLSRSGKQDASTAYNVDGSINPDCPGISITCYRCVE